MIKLSHCCRPRLFVLISALFLVRAHTGVSLYAQTLMRILSDSSASETMNNWFGSELALHAGRLYVADELYATDNARVRVFELASGTEVRSIASPSNGQGVMTGFGSNIVVNSEYIAISAPFEPNGGSVYTFSESTGDFLDKIARTQQNTHNYFGSNLQLSRDTLETL
jgi:hypothetical protein